MERAREWDRISDLRAAHRKGTRHSSGQGVAERREQFDTNAYRQPILTLQALEPMVRATGCYIVTLSLIFALLNLTSILLSIKPYRANQADAFTEETNARLRGVNRYLYMSDSSNNGEGLQSTRDFV
jgi:hypothetical protein